MTEVIESTETLENTETPETLETLEATGTPEVPGTPRKLTILDPVDMQTLQNLGALTATQSDLSSKAVELQLEYLNVIGTVRRIIQERNQLFGTLLSERGLDPRTLVNIDQNGVMTLLTE